MDLWHHGLCPGAIRSLGNVLTSCLPEVDRCLKGLKRSHDSLEKEVEAWHYGLCQGAIRSLGNVLTACLPEVDKCLKGLKRAHDTLENKLEARQSLMEAYGDSRGMTSIGANSKIQ